jgi:hypothetical protein
MLEKAEYLNIISDAFTDITNGRISNIYMVSEKHSFYYYLENIKTIFLNTGNFADIIYNYIITIRRTI